MSHPIVYVFLALFSGAGMGFLTGGAIGALVAVLYLLRVHKNEIKEMKEEAARDAEKAFALGVQTGKGYIEVRNYFRRTGFFGRRLEYVTITFDSQDNRIKNITGHVENYELFSNIPPEVKDAIKSFLIAAVKNIRSIAA